MTYSLPAPEADATVTWLEASDDLNSSRSNFHFRIEAANLLINMLVRTSVSNFAGPCPARR